MSFFKRFFTIVAAVAVAVAGGLSPCSSTHATPAKGTAKQIIALERRYSQSFITGDANVAQRVLADDFAGFGPSGKSCNKAIIISTVRAVPHQASAKIISIHVRLFGATAIASGTEADTDAGSPVIFYRRWLDTWRHFRSGWRMVASAEAATAG